MNWPGKQWRYWSLKINYNSSSNYLNTYKFMAINVVDDYLFILMIYEKAVIGYYGEHPKLNDPQVIAAFSSAMNFFTRQKKGLPDLPVTLTGDALGLFNKLKEVTDIIIDPNPEKEMGGIDVIFTHISISAAIACLKRLKESAENWHKRDGFRGYLNFIIDHV
jgi:hypothetical protein